jgi:hypothetical protein
VPLERDAGKRVYDERDQPGLKESAATTVGAEHAAPLRPLSPGDIRSATTAPVLAPERAGQRYGCAGEWSARVCLGQ